MACLYSNDLTLRGKEIKENMEGNKEGEDKGRAVKRKTQTHTHTHTHKRARTHTHTHTHTNKRKHTHHTSTC